MTNNTNTTKIKGVPLILTEEQRMDIYLKAQKVKVGRPLLSNYRMTNQKIADEYNISERTVRRISKAVKAELIKEIAEEAEYNT